LAFLLSDTTLEPSEAATVALRTQQVIANESGLAALIDPLGGSYALESMTHSLETEALALIEDMSKRGGVVSCIEQQFQQNLIQQAAYDYQMDIENKKKLVVGLNAYQEQTTSSPPILKIDPRVEKEQVARLQSYKSRRNLKQVEECKSDLIRAAKEDLNLMPSIFQSVKNAVTLGEIVGALESVYGRYRP
jgi:methylmalonyl-CoA mutase N-terminal domain/subunit